MADLVRESRRDLAERLQSIDPSDLLVRLAQAGVGLFERRRSDPIPVRHAALRVGQQSHGHGKEMEHHDLSQPARIEGDRDAEDAVHVGDRRNGGHDQPAGDAEPVGTDENRDVVQAQGEFVREA